MVDVAWSEKPFAVSIAEADIVMGLVDSVVGKNAQISIPVLRTRLNTGDQIFDAGVRMSAFGAGLVKTDATGIIGISNQITVDPSAPAGSLVIDDVGKTTLNNSLIINAQGVTSSDGITLIGDDTNSRELTIHIDSSGNPIIACTGAEIIKVNNLINFLGGSRQGDNNAAQFGASADYSQFYSTANQSFQINAGSVVDTNVRLEIDSAGDIKTKTGIIRTIDSTDIVLSQVGLTGAGDYAIKQSAIGLTKINSSTGNAIRFSIADATKMSVNSDGSVSMTGLKSGANQGAAGAAANELWVDTADQSIKLGV